MARLPRSVLPPFGIYHVTTRGVDRRAVFLSRDDRIEFLVLLAEATERRSWKLHAFCLMTNHYHLVVEAAREPLSLGLHGLNGTYAEYFNGAHGRWGHLWGDRFASWVVRGERHLEATCDYVRANPVRAGICASPTDYVWSDARAAAARARRPRTATRPRAALPG